MGCKDRDGFFRRNAGRVGLMAMTLLADVAAGGNFPDNSSDKPTCEFVLILKDAEARLEYQWQVARDMQAAPTRFAGVQEMYDHIAPAAVDDAALPVIDRFSRECLSCHDGLTAKSHRVRTKNSPETWTGGMASIIDSHPIGMHYESYTMMNQADYRRINDLERSIVLIDSRVGCLSCHNPLNPEPNHLAVNNTRSELCYSCHNR